MGVVLKEEFADIVRFLQLCNNIIHFDDVTSKDSKAFFELITPTNMKFLYQVAKDRTVNDGHGTTEAHLRRLNKIQLVEAMVMETMEGQALEEDEDNTAWQHGIDMSRRRRMRNKTSAGTSRMKIITTTATAAQRLKMKTTATSRGMSHER